MATLSYLTDVIGPRLTASPAMKRANDWTRERLATWGLENAHLEKWGPFGKGWTLKKFSMQVVEPQCIPLIAFPKAWSPGTDGTVVGEVVDLDAIKTEADLDKLKGKLKGAFVLLGPPRDVQAHFEPLGSRLTDKELLELANAAEPAARRARQPPAGPAAAGTPAVAGQRPGRPARRRPAPAPAGPGGRFGAMTPEQRAAAQLQRKKMTFAMEEGAAAILDASTHGRRRDAVRRPGDRPGRPAPRRRPRPGRPPGLGLGQGRPEDPPADHRLQGALQPAAPDDPPGRARSRSRSTWPSSSTTTSTPSTPWPRSPGPT